MSRGSRSKGVVTLVTSLIISVIWLITTCIGVSADTQSSSGAIQLDAQVPGNPPATAATILTPVEGQEFHTNPILVSGDCINGMLVNVYKNGTLAGSTICSDTGAYQLSIDLLVGKNALTVQQFNDLGRGSPVSSVVNVTYVPFVSPIVTPSSPAVSSSNPPNTSELNAVTFQLALKAKVPLIESAPGAVVTWSVDIEGGHAPYALSWNWGDGVTDPISVTQPGKFNASHTYTKAATYALVVKASDVQNSHAYLQLVQRVTGSTANGPLSIINKVANLSNPWWLYVGGGVLFLGTSFALGMFWGNRRWLRPRFKRAHYPHKPSMGGGELL